MSGLFGLDDAGNQALRDEIAANPISPEDVRAGAWAGIPEAAIAFPFKAAGSAARLLELAGSVPVTIVGSLLAPQTDVAQKYFETFDPSVKGWNDYWTPNPKTVGTAGRVLSGFGQSAALLAAGGGNPSLLIASTGAEGSMSLAEQGVSPDVAAAGGALEGASTALGFKVPFFGKSLPMRVASGAVGFPALNAATVEAQRQLLLATGYTNVAAAYEPFNGTDRAIDVLVGGLFGAVHHYGAGGMPITADTRDAALALANARHLHIDTAPGFPADIATSAIHQQTIEQAMGQLLRDEPVTPPAELAEATFESKPPTLQPADVPNDLQQLDAERAPAGQSLENLKIQSDIAAVNVPEQTRAQLGEMYTAAARAKPALDAALKEVSVEIGTPHEPKLVDLKGVDRAAEKAVSDYGGNATHLKDIVRGTIVVDTPEQVQKAIEALKARFGEPTKQRNTLSQSLETTDGYRDVNLNVLVGGHVSEVQINYPEMLAAKDEMHPLYKERRAIEARIKNGEIAPEDIARINELDAHMRERYAAAWADALSRLKSASEISKPSSRAQESVTGLPPGTSNARIETPPSGVGSAATGTSPTFQKTGSLPNTGAAIESPPTPGILPESGTPKAASAHNTAPGGEKVEPAVQSAAQLVTQRPDLRVATGNLNADGTVETISAAEAMARDQQEIAAAEANAKAFSAAVNCAAQRGVQ